MRTSSKTCESDALVPRILRYTNYGSVFGSTPEKSDFQNCCEALTLNLQCTSESAVEAKQLREKVAENVKTNTALKTNHKD